MAANDYYQSSRPLYASDKPLPYNPHDNLISPEVPQSRYSPSGSYSESDSHLIHDPRYANTAYGGASRPTIRDDTPLDSRDDIPLQSQPPKDYSHDPSFASPGRQPSDTLPLNPEAAERGRKKKKFDWTKIPWVTYILSLIQLTVFIVEIVKMSTLTGSPIQTKPNFNPMVGPSPYVLINMGARYVPCMRNQDLVQNSPSGPISWPCPNTTDTTADCQLSDLCGFGGVPNPKSDGSLSDNPAPNQWFRFIVPIFLHGGIVHIAGNLLLQLLLARDMEKVIGSIRFALVYFSSGIFGFVLGGNFAASGIAATGCSGSLFGIISLVVLDLIYTWGSRKNPIRDLIFLVLVIAVQVVIGLLPTGLDNFSHIGGLLMGFVLGISILHSPNTLRKHYEDDAGTFNEHLARDQQRHKSSRSRSRSKRHKTDELISGTQGMDASAFIKHPLSFFKGRKPLWWVWWLFRAAATVAVFIGFILLLNNFYNTHKSNCSWCKYMSCLDVNGWCDQGQLKPMPTTSSVSGPQQTSAPQRRSFLEI